MLVKGMMLLSQGCVYSMCTQSVYAIATVSLSGEAPGKVRYTHSFCQLEVRVSLQLMSAGTQHNAFMAQHSASSFFLIARCLCMMPFTLGSTLKPVSSTLHSLEPKPLLLHCSRAQSIGHCCRRSKSACCAQHQWFMPECQ